MEYVKTPAELAAEEQQRKAREQERKTLARYPVTGKRVDFGEGAWADLRSARDVLMREKMEIKDYSDAWVAWTRPLELAGYDPENNERYDLMVEAKSKFKAEHPGKLLPWDEYCAALVCTYTTGWFFPELPDGGVSLHDRSDLAKAIEIPDGPYQYLYTWARVTYRGEDFSMDGIADPKDRAATGSDSGSEPG